MAYIFSNDKNDQDENMPALFENNFVDIGSYEEHYNTQDECQSDTQMYTKEKRNMDR